MADNSQLWLQQLLAQHGGRASFAVVMDWLLNDSQHGFYGSGRCCFGPRGDFVTAPSLGSGLADLLLKQLIPCFDLLSEQPGKLSLIEWGPGNGLLAVQLVKALLALSPHGLPAWKFCCSNQALLCAWFNRRPSRIQLFPAIGLVQMN